MLTKRIKLNLLFNLSYLNSNFALTLGYLNPALNNLALRVRGRGEDQNYLEKDSQERAKQSEVVELGSSQSGCTRQKVLVRQRGSLMHLLARRDMMIMMMMMMMRMNALGTAKYLRLSPFRVHTTMYTLLKYSCYKHKSSKS